MQRAGMCVWAATAAGAANEAFNMVDGDFFRWQTVFPQIGKDADLEFARPSLSLTAVSRASR